MNRIRPIHRAALLALLLPTLALAAPAPGKPSAGPAASAAPAADNAPFYTGKPTGAAFAKVQAQRIARAKAAIARMLAVKGKRTVDNTLVPFDDAYRVLYMANAQSGLIQEVHPDKATRTAAEKASQEVSAYITELSLDRHVYDAIAAIDTSTADAATRFYVWRTLRDFHLAGVDKDDATRARIKALNDSLVLVSQEFERNLATDTTGVTCTVAELDGLPADFIAAHKPGPDGRVHLTTQYPDFYPVIQYAKSDDLRHRLYVAYCNRAWPGNGPVLQRLRQERYDLANTVGFPNWAAYFTADKMVGTAANAQAFIDRVVAASDARQAREYDQLLAELKKTDPAATVVQYWQFFWVQEQVRRSAYNFDSQSVRPYFPYVEVKAGVLDIASRLFGVTFKRVTGVPVWHPSVECYELWDGGKLAGRFYLDMHPRNDKYKHAAQFDIRTGVAGRQIPEAALVCNLPEPTKDNPDALCDYEDVNTFFHEFGHLLHNMFASHGRWSGIAGISTEQDFVEAPSQMLEEWMRSPEVLATFAKDVKTHQPIPADLVKQMNRANDFGKGLTVRRQMVYAGTSLACYDADPSATTSDELFTGLMRKYQPFPPVEGIHFTESFGHLVNYSAGYYTYMWSSVIAKDMFAQFDKDHLLAPGVAARYRSTVLAPGGSKPAAQLVAEFLGRPFDERAWKAWLDSDN